MDFIKEFEPIRYIGTSTSHFQSEPVVNGPDGAALPPCSDWEFELAKNLAGKPSGIKDPQKLEEFPHFLRNSEKYIQRNRELAQNMFCFSIEWSRLCRSPGEFDENLMTEYVKVIARAKASNQEPLVTIYHFAMPLFLAVVDTDGNIRKGGWEHPEVLVHFRFYVGKVVDFLADQDRIRAILEKEGYSLELRERFVEEGLVRYFISVNEPGIVAFLGYVAGIFPPFQKARIFGAKKVLRKMAQAHDIARAEIQRLGAGKKPERQPRCGVAHACQYFDGILGAFAEHVSQYAVEIFERDGKHSDFFGLHYYFRKSFLPLAWRRTLDFGDHPTFGDIFPKGIFSVLKKMSRLYPGKDIFISEIGFADGEGSRRPEWLAETIKYIMEARREGMPIRGVLFWSLADNFEWNLGMRVAKFGLFSEAQLLLPLPETEKNIRSWQVWQKASRALRTPSTETMLELQTSHDLAEKRYKDRLSQLQKVVREASAP